MTTITRLYDSVKWRKARATYLSHHPLCVMCARLGKGTAATVVDHIVPHNGNQSLFWSRDNWQGLCAACHGIKRIADHGRTLPGCDISGVPTDPGHHWNRETV